MKKLQKIRHDDKIDEQCAQREEAGRREKIGREGVALVLVEARRHESIDLRKNDRAGKIGGGEDRHLDLGEEILLRRGVDQLRVGAGRMFERHQENIVDVLGKIETNQEHNDEGEERPNQPRPQLDQMID